ncbi:MAG TPA: DUF4168 domain-containing protein [Povalibacter sp.]
MKRPRAERMRANVGTLASVDVLAFGNAAGAMLFGIQPTPTDGDNVMTKFIRSARGAFIASALVAAGPAAVYAQETDLSSPPQTTATAPTTAPVEEAKVEQFAAAFVAVQDIQAQATEQLSSAKDDAQATEVKAKAEKKMIEAVQHEGLEVEEFNRIADLMTTDLALRSKVVEKVEKRRKG